MFNCGLAAVEHCVMNADLWSRPGPLSRAHRDFRARSLNGLTERIGEENGKWADTGSVTGSSQTSKFKQLNVGRRVRSISQGRPAMPVARLSSSRTPHRDHFGRGCTLSSFPTRFGRLSRERTGALSADG